MNLIDKITASQIRTDLPEFRVGDTIRVGVKISEKDSKGNEKIRVQAFEGLVMAIQNSGIGKTFIVRKVSAGVGVERTFPMNSPIIDTIEVVKKGKVRQAKLGYIRNMTKQPRIKERRSKDSKKAA